MSSLFYSVDWNHLYIKPHLTAVLITASCSIAFFFNPLEVSIPISTQSLLSYFLSSVDTCLIGHPSFTHKWAFDCVKVWKEIFSPQAGFEPRTKQRNKQHQQKQKQQALFHSEHEAKQLVAKHKICLKNIERQKFCDENLCWGGWGGSLVGKRKFYGMQFCM